MAREELRKIEIENLSARQKEVFLLYDAGMSQTEIAKKLGCSCQNISVILKTIKKNSGIKEKTKRKSRSLPNEEKKKIQNQIKENNAKYNDVNISTFSPREREVMKKRLECKTYKEIADELGISTKSVSVLLSRARDKLSGKKTYAQKNKDKYNARRRTPEHREKEKKWHRNFVNNHPEFREKIREYNKKYYQENRERILEKQCQGTRRPLGSVDKCQWCGAEYTVVSGNQKYCSDKCRRKDKM